MFLVPSVCLSVYPLDYLKSYERIFMRFHASFLSLIFHKVVLRRI